jgi:hypothetical protein
MARSLGNFPDRSVPSEETSPLYCVKFAVALCRTLHAVTHALLGLPSRPMHNHSNRMV